MPAAGGSAPLAGEPSAGFTGHAYESGLGLTYGQQRWEDPVTGQWLSVDPLGPQGRLASPNGLGMWAYAAGNPLRYVDWDGRQNAPAGYEGMALAISCFAEARQFSGREVEACLASKLPMHSEVAVSVAAEHASLAVDAREHECRAHVASESEYVFSQGQSVAAALTASFGESGCWAFFGIPRMVTGAGHIATAPFELWANARNSCSDASSIACLRAGSEGLLFVGGALQSVGVKGPVLLNRGTAAIAPVEPFAGEVLNMTRMADGTWEYLPNVSEAAGMVPSGQSSPPALMCGLVRPRMPSSFISAASEMAAVCEQPTRIQRYLEGPLGLRQAASLTHGLLDPRALQSRTIAVVAVRLLSGELTYYATANQARVTPAQVAELVRLGVPENHILRGSRHLGPAKADNHAEQILRRALPWGAIVEGWGISWTTPRKPVPCVGCAPVVQEAGGFLQLE